MATFEEVGFLSDELDQWKHAAHEAYADAFGYAYRGNSMALRVMKAIPTSDVTEAMKWAIAACARTTGAFQSAVVMIERGAMAEARALARLCAETVIVVKGLANVPDTLDILRESDAEHSIRAIANIIRLNADNAQPDEGALERLRVTMAELEQAFPKRRSLNYRTLALSTGLEMFYEIAYRYASGGRRARDTRCSGSPYQGGGGQPRLFLWPGHRGYGVYAADRVRSDHRAD